MKRRLSVAAVTAAAAVLVASCAGPLDPKTDDPRTLVVHSRLSPGTQGADVYASALLFAVGLVGMLVIRRLFRRPY